MMMYNPRTVTLSTSFSPVSMAVTEVFDDIIDRAKVGDQLRCVSAVTGEGYFTQGSLYTVFAPNGETNTIMDDDGMFVPRNPFRMDLLDLFELVPALDGEVEAVDTVSIPTEEHDELKNWAYKGAASEHTSLMADIRGYKEEIARLNSTDGSEVLFRKMDDEDKGAVLLAQFDNGRMQFKSPVSGWLDMPVGAFNFDPNTAYRKRPSVLSYYEDTVSALETKAAVTLEKMESFRTEPTWVTTTWS